LRIHIDPLPLDSSHIFVFLTGRSGRLCIATDYGKLCAGKRADVRWQVAARIPYFA
jgi:hypothetical protein